MVSMVTLESLLIFFLQMLEVLCKYLNVEVLDVSHLISCKTFLKKKKKKGKLTVR